VPCALSCTGRAVSARCASGQKVPFSRPTHKHTDAQTHRRTNKLTHGLHEAPVSSAAQGHSAPAVRWPQLSTGGCPLPAASWWRSAVRLNGGHLHKSDEGRPVECARDRDWLVRAVFVRSLCALCGPAQSSAEPRAQSCQQVINN